MPKDQYVDQKLDGRYHVLRLLDSGSFGAVYEARDTKLGRIVAVKILFAKHHWYNNALNPFEWFEFSFESVGIHYSQDRLHGGKF